VQIKPTLKGKQAPAPTKVDQGQVASRKRSGESSTKKRESPAKKSAVPTTTKITAATSKAKATETVAEIKPTAKRTSQKFGAASEAGFAP
jgi:hypothetical protein